METGLNTDKEAAATSIGLVLKDFKRYDYVYQGHHSLYEMIDFVSPKDYFADYSIVVRLETERWGYSDSGYMYCDQKPLKIIFCEWFEGCALVAEDVQYTGDMTTDRLLDILEALYDYKRV